MRVNLLSSNAETIEIDQVIEALELAPSKTKVMESLKRLRQDKVKTTLFQTVKAIRFDLDNVFEDFLLNGYKSKH